MANNSDTGKLIELIDLHKMFQNGALATQALSAISISINEGEYLSISGPSGCGKSTLLSQIGLLDVATRGSYIYRGSDTSAFTRLERAKIRNRDIGFIFQAFNLIGDLTVEENVLLPLSYRDDLKGREIAERTKEALDKVGLYHRRRLFPNQLSGGQQQRTAVARAIAGRPGIILADEPTGNLDSQNAEKILSLLEALNQSGVTVCMVSHDKRIYDRADRIIEMFDGKIVADRTSDPALPTIRAESFDDK